jgi:hypothetical protein
MIFYLLYKAPFMHRKTYNQQLGILGHTSVFSAFETSIFRYSDRLRHVIVNPGVSVAANLRVTCYIPTLLLC